MLYLAPLLIACCLVLALRWYARSTSLQALASKIHPRSALAMLLLAEPIDADEALRLVNKKS